jgi:hypothetical protein
MEVSCQLHTTAAAAPDTHGKEEYVGPKPVLDAMEKGKILPYQESNTRGNMYNI